MEKSNIMTTEEKNIAIAEMLGFKKGFWIHVEKPVTDDKKQYCDWDNGGSRVWGCYVYYKKQLKFHSDANWQFEVIDWIESIGEFGNSFIINNTQVVIKDCLSGEVRAFVTLNSKKEAIFEALYQFSQYLKEKHINK